MQPQENEPVKEIAGRHSEKTDPHDRRALGAISPIEKSAQSAEQIADKYLQQIPPEDNVMDEDSAPFALALLMACVDDDGGIGSTHDRLGNLPGSVLTALWDNDAAKCETSLRTAAQDPVTVYGNEGDKIQGVFNSSLPESIKNAALSILLKEGDTPVGEVLSAIAERVRSEITRQDTNTLQDPSLSKIIDQVKTGLFPQYKEADKLRLAALRHLLASIYPGFEKSEEVQYLHDARSLSFKPENEEVARAFLIRAKQLCKDDTAIQATALESITSRSESQREDFVQLDLYDAVMKRLGRKYSNQTK